MVIMRRKVVPALAICLAMLSPVFAHDLFLKLESFFVRVNEKISISILNGSFQTSEGAVSFARLRDVSVISPSGLRTNPKEVDFTKDATTAFLNLQPTETGNYLVGLSTMPREIDLSAKDFNDYLLEDGMPDTIAERKRKKESAKNIRERYSKHVKTIFQSGDKQTESFRTILGYPVEIIPQINPYTLKIGDKLEILCTKDGKPLSNQFVMSGREDTNGKLIVGPSVRTNKKGIARIHLNGSGKWYAKFINMIKMSDPKINYESKWATLTFEIR